VVKIRGFHWELDVRGTHLRSTVKSVVAILCAVCFLAMSMGSVTRAAAADDTFETWPKKPAEPVVSPKPVPDANGAGKDWEMWPLKRTEPVTEQKPVTGADAAARAGDAVEKKTASGRSYGTIGWIALGIAAAIGIAVAAGGGGGGGGGGTVTNPGHQ
jgi:hypothetical protein